MKTLALLAALAAAPVTAHADTLLLPKPLSGGTLHADSVDLSVYWTPVDGAAEVVAFYTDRPDATPARLALRLAEGEQVTFGLPGVTGAVYRFERAGEGVSVTSARTSTDLALN